MCTGEELANVNLLEIEEEQLLEYLEELQNNPSKGVAKLKNSPILDGSMESLFTLINEGLDVREERTKGSLNDA